MDFNKYKMKTRHPHLPIPMPELHSTRPKIEEFEEDSIKVVEYEQKIKEVTTPTTKVSGFSGEKNHN